MSDSGVEEPSLKKHKNSLHQKEPKKPYEQYFNDKDNFVHDVKVNLTDKCLFNEIDKHYHSDIILFYNQNDGNEALEITYDNNMDTPISTRVLPAISDEEPEHKALVQETQASQAVTEPGSPVDIIYSQHTGNYKNYLTRGGAPIVRRISASLHDGRARQSRNDVPEFELHRKFFLLIWKHFAPDESTRKRPDASRHTHFNIRLPIYKDRKLVCNVILRCVTRRNNIAYSILFEFTPYIHWSIFYSFDLPVSDLKPLQNLQVSQFHFTLNEYHFNTREVTPKTRMFFEYTNYINSLIGGPAMSRDRMSVSSKEEQVRIMGIVSELMLLTMYQLATAKSYTTGHIFNNAALTMRQNIDSVGHAANENELLKIASRHVALIGCIQEEFGRYDQIFPSEDFINHLKTDIRAITLARPGGGKNINRYLTKINNIKEKLKLLKKNKVKNKVKITKLSKSIDELKAKLKKQKEKEKAKIKKQKEKEKAKLKKQKEKEKAKLKKQKEKEKSSKKKKT